MVDPTSACTDVQGDETPRGMAYMATKTRRRDGGNSLDCSDDHVELLRGAPRQEQQDVCCAAAVQKACEVRMAGCRCRST